MFLELISVIVAGFAGAGVALLVLRFVPALPRWLVPLGAGAAMLVVALANEYGWYGRQLANLPEGLEVAMTHEARSPLRPWTLVLPFTNRFLAVDRGAIQTHPARPDLRMTDLYLFARWQPVAAVPAVFDCARGRRADLRAGVTMAADGTLSGAQWIPTGLEDPVTAIACKEG